MGQQVPIDLTEQQNAEEMNLILFTMNWFLPQCMLFLMKMDLNMSVEIVVDLCLEMVKL